MILLNITQFVKFNYKKDDIGIDFILYIVY